MGDSSVEVTEESRESSQLAKAKAMEAISEGNIFCEVNNKMVITMWFFNSIFVVIFWRWMDTLIIHEKKKRIYGWARF